MCIFVKKMTKISNPYLFLDNICKKMDGNQIIIKILYKQIFLFVSYKNEGKF